MIKINFLLRHRYTLWVWALLLTAYLLSSHTAYLFAQGATPVPPLPQQNRLSPPQKIDGAITKRATDHIVAHIYFHNQGERNRLAAQYDVWQIERTAHREHGYLVALLSTAEVTRLQSQGYRVEIDENRSAQLAQPPVIAGAQSSGIPGYACYRTVEETYITLAT